MIPLLLFGTLCWLALFKLSSDTCDVSYEKRGGGGGSDVETTSHTYYYYKIKFAHTSIDPTQAILFYDAVGALVYTLPPHSSVMNYGQGILAVPGTEQNVQVEGVATASYYVFYSLSDLVIDYKRAEFKIAKKLIKYPAQTEVSATYEYLSVITAFKDIASVIDGRYDTQVQTEFYAEPPTGYNYAIIDLGVEQEVQALDIIAGFYKPDDIRKFDIQFSISLQYSTDGVDYYPISSDTQNISFTGGESKSFEESDLGVGFAARYFKLILEDVSRIEFGSMRILRDNTIVSSGSDPTTALITVPFDAKATDDTIISYGIYAIAFTEVAAYNNIVMTSTSSLIPTCIASSSIGIGAGTINVDSTTQFNASGTAYIDDNDGTFDSFNYTGLTDTSFTGVTGVTTEHGISSVIVETIEDDNTIYDYGNMIEQLGDRVYKVNKVSDNALFSQAQLDYVSKMYLKEYIKNHSKIRVNVVYAPHIEIGQTIRVVDSYNNTNRNYFVDSISDNNGTYSLVLARYDENDLIYE